MHHKCSEGGESVVTWDIVVQLSSVLHAKLLVNSAVFCHMLIQRAAETDKLAVAYVRRVAVLP